MSTRDARGRPGPRSPLTPAQVRAELPFEPARVISSPGGFAFERFAGLGSCALDRPPETHHRLVLLDGPSRRGDPAGRAGPSLVRWSVGGGRPVREVSLAAAPAAGAAPLCLVPAGCPHAWELSGGPLDTAHLLVSPAALEALAGEAGLRGRAEVPPAPLFADAALATLVRQIAAEAARPGGGASPDGALLVECLTRAAGVHLLRRARPAGASAPRRRRAAPLDARRVADVRALLLANPSRRVTLAEMAAAAGLNCADHFGRSFRLATGRTPSRYRTGLAARVAAAMLRADPDISVGGAALACGFCDQSHLTRAMVRELGVRPSQARRGAVPSREGGA